MTSWSSSIKIWFLKKNVMVMQKYAIGEQNVMKFEVLILGGQRNYQKRNKGWWRGSRERIEMEAG